MNVLQKTLFLALLPAALSLSASAQTLIHQWRFGEDDPGASNGGAVTTTRDAVGTTDLSVTGVINYTTLTAGSPSSLAQSFGVSASYTGAFDHTLSNSSNFIIEGWYYLNGTQQVATNILFYNGNPSSSGAGLYVRGSALHYLQGGNKDDVAGSLTANQWNYVALVYQPNAVKVFVNGDTAPSYSASLTFRALDQPAQTFSIGGGLNGRIDELRVSTFTGSFSTAMLSYDAISPIPEPSTYAALAGLAALGLVAWRRRQCSVRA